MTAALPQRTAESRALAAVIWDLVFAAQPVLVFLLALQIVRAVLADYQVSKYFGDGIAQVDIVIGHYGRERHISEAATRMYGLHALSVEVLEILHALGAMNADRLIKGFVQPFAGMQGRWVTDASRAQVAQNQLVRSVHSNERRKLASSRNSLY